MNKADQVKKVAFELGLKAAVMASQSESLTVADMPDILMQAHEDSLKTLARMREKGLLDEQNEPIKAI